MAGIHRFDAEGVLTINSFVMNRAAIATQGISRLWVEVDKRGANRILPRLNGVVTLPLRNTETRHNLSVLVVGGVQLDGTPLGSNDDQREQLVTNLDGLYDNVVNQPLALASTLTIFGQSPRAANVQVLGMREVRIKLRPTFAAWLGTLEINVPGGRFE